MEQAKSNDVPVNESYEAPRLQTYGKLETLTKGSAGSKDDGATLQP